MPHLSVVVPIYNVEEFLPACLGSVAAQTFGDFEVIMVDDGSTDGSAKIAEDFARRDRRFVLISQENGGLSKARNTGTDHATGEYLAFLDSDDELPPNAYELLSRALDKTGSDFATGNVHRLTRFGTSQSPFLARTFAETRLKTHVTEFRPLLADRTAWNKMWRRSFWDRHSFRFPEGRIFEDTPVTVPAHFVADSVDVIAEPVYHWRIREGGALSITQRRVEPRALRDRMTAIEEVSRFLADNGPRGAKRWYDESVVADDLRYYVNALDAADDEYRTLFLERVNAFLDSAGSSIYDPLPAIERLKWHLVRRRLMPELLEVLRFQKEDLSRTPPVRVRGRWYGDYPFRTDRSLEIPRSVYRLEGELTLSAHVQEVTREGDKLRIRGHAYINGVGAPAEGAQRVDVAALRPSRLRRLLLLTSAGRARTTPVPRPDVTADSRQALSDLSWSGFDATLDPQRLRTRRGWREATWEMFITVRAPGVKRRRSRFVLDGGRPPRALELVVADDVTVTASVTPGNGLVVDVRRQAATLRSARLADRAVLELAGDLRVPETVGAALEIRDQNEELRLRVPLEIGDASAGSFTARVRVDKLRAAETATDEEDEDESEDENTWQLWVAGGGRRTPVMLDAALSGESFAADEREVSITRGARGADLIVREPAAVVTGARWTDQGALELRGRLPAGARRGQLLLVRTSRGEQHAFSAESDGAGGFSATLTPARISSLAGELPLQEGIWRVYARVPESEGPARPLILAEELIDQLPLTAVVDHKAFVLGARKDGGAVLRVRRDLDDDERGAYHQERLRRTVYQRGRDAPLRDAVVYSSFLGRQYSDSPRAIHEELVRRNAPLEHLWVVRDGRCRVPETARVLREGSRDYHEALARARFVVANDHFPDWFARRPDQVALQTWHGTPLKRVGFDVSDLRKTVRRFERRWEQQADNWQYVVSPNAFSTPILRRAYGITGQILETGYPRVDILARADREELARGLRRRLGLPDDKRTVLYAPTYRDHVVDRRGRFRLDLRLDLERLRDAVGDDTIILFRKHHYVIDAPPATADGFVRDVSSFPDGTELMLAADVLLTDYSSMTVDYANTGRPMLFYTYDLDAYRDETRGLYLDLADSAPGPLLPTTDAVAEALRDLDGVRSAFQGPYEAFRATFCELDDGRASARVVDAVFAPALTG